MVFVHVCVVSVLHIAAIYVVMKKIREEKLVSKKIHPHPLHFPSKGGKLFPLKVFILCTFV